MSNPNTTRPLKHRATRGFTLTEMLVVMAIIAILAGVAVWSARANQNKAAMSDFTGAVMGAFKEARGRATATGRRYAVQITQTSVRWCEDKCPSIGTPTSSKPIGRFVNARDGAQAPSYARAGDIGVGNRPTLIAIPSNGYQVYFYGDGTMDSDIDPSTQEGFTVYLQHKIDTDLQFRVAVLPFAGDIKKYVSWD